MRFFFVIKRVVYAGSRDSMLLERYTMRWAGGLIARRYSGSRRKKISKVLRLFCQLAVMQMGYPGAEVARFPGVATSAVVRVAHFQDLPEIENYL